MATAQQARAQLSKDLGDYFASITTSAAGGATTLVDTRLTDEDDDEFVTKRATLWILGGQTGGPTSDEERGLSSKSGATATMKRGWSVTVQGSVNYEAHRLFTAEEKDRAITDALNHITGVILFERLTSTVTTVADQYDYDISSKGYYRNTPRQVHLVDADDSEITEPLYDWEILNGTTLHLNTKIVADKTLRMFGHKASTLTNLTDGSGRLLILTAYAATILINQAIMSSPLQQVGRWQTALQSMQARYIERLTRFMEIGYAQHVYSDALHRKTTGDIHWNVV